ncbi:MAG: hypothetical protein RLN85_07890, partial [Pseudomonadales bacterium]
MKLSKKVLDSSPEDLERESSMSQGSMAQTASPSVAVDYNMDVVRWGALATVFWGVIGFLVGDVIAWQLAFPVLNFDNEFLNFGRLRPSAQRPYYSRQ